MSRHEHFCRADQPNQRSSAFKRYIGSCHDKSALIDALRPIGLTLNALNHITSWHYSKGSQAHDAQLSLWLKKEMKPLFTSGVHNKILSLMRKRYDQIVLIEYNIIEENGKIRPEKVSDND